MKEALLTLLAGIADTYAGEGPPPLDTTWQRGAAAISWLHQLLSTCTATATILLLQHACYCQGPALSHVRIGHPGSSNNTSTVTQPLPGAGTNSGPDGTPGQLQQVSSSLQDLQFRPLLHPPLRPLSPITDPQARAGGSDVANKY